MRQSLQRRPMRAMFHAFGAAGGCVLLLAALPSHAAVPSTAACDGGDAVVLAADTGPHPEARAVWLDRHTLRWPGAPADGRYRLYAGDILPVAKPGQRVRGAAQAIGLTPSAQPADEVVQRFRHVAAGATLAIGLDDESLRTLHRQALLLVREDERGRVLEATRTPRPGALDDLYAAAVAAPPPGAHPSPEGTRSSVWAPTAREASLCLHADDQGAAIRRVPAERDADTGMWTAHLPEDLRGSYYTWLVDVHVPGTGLVRNRVTDPY